MENVDDGSDKPIGTVSEDGELEVREFVDSAGAKGVGWCETDLGQHQRWMRGAPELYERFQAVVEQRDKLRSALATLVGASTREELEQLEVGLRLTPAPAEDKAASIDAVHALLATLA